jgi:hypothetical protein
MTLKHMHNSTRSQRASQGWLAPHTSKPAAQTSKQALSKAKLTARNPKELALQMW